MCNSTQHNTARRCQTKTRTPQPLSLKFWLLQAVPQGNTYTSERRSLPVAFPFFTSGVFSTSTQRAWAGAYEYLDKHASQLSCSSSGKWCPSGITSLLFSLFLSLWAQDRTAGRFRGRLWLSNQSQSLSQQITPFPDSCAPRNVRQEAWKRRPCRWLLH